MTDITLELLALLFVAKEPLKEEELSKLLNSNALETITLLNTKWEEENYPLQIVKTSEGYILKTRASYQGVIDKLLKGSAKERLSPASLEVLAIILHKGPISRSSIDQLRGVDCLNLIQSLLDKELIEVERCPERKIPLYRSTKRLLSLIQ